jgi:hypothetical protein
MNNLKTLDEISQATTSNDSLNENDLLNGILSVLQDMLAEMKKNNGN